ncbi:conserved exported hypothetical protein [Crenothrix polyspora]|uniref:Tyrosinase copper-binding domain-containing protein n=1 Tax=Crenothrix polyspora TaxID=360316 RepID=A0A1R4H7B9_9GAMM|nr:tyrosinase family protein [Crenothrix polyspora]SJM91921.1 conserved exported hypothetical protein [Crenothrix polyspora]
MKYKCMALIVVAAFSYNSLANADFVRISASDFVKDPVKVAALQKAVVAMRTNDAATNTSPKYRASWQYWANTHGYLGAGPNAAGTVANYVPQQTARFCSGNPVCTSYYQHLIDTPLPADGFTTNVWGTCQHGNLNFLPWHRMYLHFFERVLRKQSGTADFSLPYWDYFSERGADGQGIALPKLVRGQSAGAAVDQFRTPGLNEHTVAIDERTGSAAQAFKFTNFTRFSNQLEQQPHGAMHCGTGSSCRAPDIGLVPLAGLDPVFYMHHANIDRLWQCWLNREAHNQTIDLAWAKANLGMPDSWYQTSYKFVDENGNVVSMKIADVFTPGVIDTHYDKETNCVTSLPSPQLPAVKAIAPMKLIPMSNTKATVLKGNAVTIPLQASSDTHPFSISPGVMGVKKGNAQLIIENVDVQGDPEVTYNIYISSKRDPKRTVYIATLNYFGILEPTHSEHSQPNANAPGNVGTLTYDVQEELSELGLTSTADVEVRFVPSNFVTEAVKAHTTEGSVTVGKVHLIKSNDGVVK